MVVGRLSRRWAWSLGVLRSWGRGLTVGQPVAGSAVIRVNAADSWVAQGQVAGMRSQRWRWPWVRRGQLGTGVRAFAADDDPHRLRPACQGEQAGQLGDLGFLVDAAVGGRRRRP